MDAYECTDRVIYDGHAESGGDPQPQQKIVSLLVEIHKNR
jgi:hypothetical protein